MAGLALLSVAPLLSATSSITFTLSEDTFIRPLMHTSPVETELERRHHTNRALPSLIGFTRNGLAIIFTTYPLSIATAAANLARHDANVNISAHAATRPRVAAGFYLAGLIFSVLHFPFGPGAMRHLNHVKDDMGVEGDPGADNTASMVSWLRINSTRAFVADLPSWTCYFVAFMVAMS
ncbi:hypothetical protein VM1G_07485 [Cytospora mali]|uniref:Integral membrane protein n=1 Tax=Cytospora mali TaxID=578113 RepID=A0A194W5V1_CYTMA|nr:hypothetical protein VM1G_07485 [Valsa mali]